MAAALTATDKTRQPATASYLTLLLPGTLLQVNLTKERAVVSVRAGSHRVSDLSRSTKKKACPFLLAAQSHKAFYTHLSSSFHVKALNINFKHHLMYNGSFLRCL